MQESLHRLRRGNSRPDDANDGELMKRSLMSIRRIRQERMDQDLLHRTVMEACQFSYGAKMVEVWVWDSEQSKLFRPEGGWWIDPYWHREGHAANSETCTFCQLVDEARTDFIAPPLLSPGVGIPGVLWSDLGHNTRRNRRRESGVGSNGGSGILDSNFLLQVFGNASFNPSDSRFLGDVATPARIAWRDVKALAEDPDQPHNHRLQVMASTDLRWTCGVPFQIKGQEGIVVYYARDTVNLTKLRDKVNTDYLEQASDFIGSAWALRLPRLAAVKRRQAETTHNFQRVKFALLFLIREGVSLHELGKESSETTHFKRTRRQKMNLHLSDIFHPPDLKEGCHLTLYKNLKKKSRQSLLKLRGAGTQAPPTSGWKVCIFSTFGVLFSIWSVCAVNDAIVNTWGSDYGAPSGPTAALLALQFGLTAAPAAQPRTIMVGQIVSILIALAFAELPAERAWIRQSLSCAVSVGAMAKIGVVNPPAAANAFIFASGAFKFTNMAVALLANILAILCSVFINNLSNKRQYPSFWGIPPILQFSFCLPKAKTKVHTEEDPAIEALLHRTRERRKKAEQAEQTEIKKPPDDEGKDFSSTHKAAMDLAATDDDDDRGSTKASSEFLLPEDSEGSITLEQAETGTIVRKSSPPASAMRGNTPLGSESDRSVRFHQFDAVESGAAPSDRPKVHSRHRRSKAFI